MHSKHNGAIIKYLPAGLENDKVTSMKKDKYTGSHCLDENQTVVYTTISPMVTKARDT